MSNNKTVLKFKPLDPPADWVRKIKQQPSFNDMVDAYVHGLAETNAEFHRLISTFHNSHSVGGKLVWDDAVAAQMIQAEALASDDVIVGKAKLDLVIHALRIVLKRWGISRKDRLNKMHGEQVAEEAADEDAEADTE